MHVDERKISGKAPEFKGKSFLFHLIPNTLRLFSDNGAKKDPGKKVRRYKIFKKIRSF